MKVIATRRLPEPKPLPIEKVHLELTPQEAADLLSVVGYIGGGRKGEHFDAPYAGTVRATTNPLHAALREFVQELPAPRGHIVRGMDVSD